MRKISKVVLIAIVIVFALVNGTWYEKSSGAAHTQSLFPTYSSPIAITSDDRFVWAVNPDNDSVSVFEVGGGVNLKIAEIPVGDGPRCVAITPDDRRAYVTNAVSGTVSVIDASDLKVIKTIKVGTEPFGCALNPNGQKLYVANFSSDNISIINTSSNKVQKTIENVGPKPAGIAITADHKGNGNNKVYVTHFLAELRNDGRSVEEKEGRDDGKEGRVSVISASSDKVINTVVLNPIANTGFLSNGSTLDRVPLRFNAMGGQIFDTVTGAFPNLLESVVIKGDRAYLPNTASSPNGPFRFNVNVQSGLWVIDTGEDEEAVDQTINMNRNLGFESAATRLFITNPIAIAFKHNADEGFAVSAATDRLVRVELDAAGKPTINAPKMAGDPGNIIRIVVGKNPRGIVINSTDTRAYVMNFISRDMSVVDIADGSATKFTELARISSASLPTPGTLEAVVHRGHELFVTAIGPAGTVANSLPPAGRMSDTGWGSCYGCHADGLTDGVTWMFADGPRQTISMESTFEHPQPPSCVLNAFSSPTLPSCKQRALNWSAVRDEIQDFELNIRGVSGGQGLITDGLGVFNLTPTANTGRSADLDAIAAFIAFGIRAPISPLRGQDVSNGRALFAQANCQSCHGGVNWTRSRINFTPPPGAGVPIVAGQLTDFLFKVGTFDPTAFNELRANQTANTVANGALGINNPSLVSVFAGAPYFHSGSAQTLDDVLNNVTHRSAGTGGVDTLSSAADRRELVRFLKSIDAQTPPFP